MHIVTKTMAIQFIDGKSHVMKQKSRKTTLSGYYVCFMWLVSNGLGGGHTHTEVQIKKISRNQVHVAEGHVHLV